MVRECLASISDLIERLVSKCLPDLSDERRVDPGNGRRRRILIPVGEQGLPDLPLEVARSIGKLEHCEVILAYVVAPEACAGELTASERHDGVTRRRLAEVSGHFERAGIAVRSIVVPGRSPDEAVDALADDLDVDVVVHGLDRAKVRLEWDGVDAKSLSAADVVR